MMTFDELCDALKAYYDRMTSNPTEEDHLTVLDLLDQISKEIDTAWSEVSQ